MASAAAREDVDGLSGPGKGGRFDFNEFYDKETGRGALVLVTPTEYKTGIVTSFSTEAKPTADAVEADIVVLDGPNEGEEVEGALFFQGGIIAQLKKKIGKSRVVGRVGQEPPSKKGYDPKWVLEDPTPDDIETARAWLRANEPDPFST